MYTRGRSEISSAMISARPLALVADTTVVVPVADRGGTHRLWIWSGGWLANLGSNLGHGHGLVDVGAAGLVHLLGAMVALAGILVCLPRKPRLTSPGTPVPLPPVHLPLLAVFGAGLLLVGSLAWTQARPRSPEWAWPQVPGWALWSVTGFQVGLWQGLPAWRGAPGLP